MADIRINSLPSTATSFNTDDYIAIDGASGGTRKMLAATLPLTDVTLGASGPSVKSSLSARAPRQGLVFDGTAGATWAGFTPSSSDFTVAAWFSANSLAANNVIIDGTGPSSGFAFYVATDGSIRRLNRNAGTTETTAAGLIVTGKRYHIAYVRGAFYLNGVSVLTFTDTQNYTAALTRIGWSAGSDSFCTGFLSVLIYNRALSASEVVALYEAAAPAGADYNSASNTSKLTGANSDFSSAGNWTVTGSTTISGGKLNLSNGDQAYCTPGNISVPVGGKFRVTLTVDSITAGSVQVYTGGIGGWVNIATTAGTFTQEFTFSAASGPTPNLNLKSTGGNAVVDTVLYYQIGLLLAPDAAQAGGGLTWYDTSGNAANITLPASGVSWNVPWASTIPGAATVASASESALSLTTSSASGNSRLLRLITSNSAATNSGFTIESAATNAASRNWGVSSNNTAYGDLAILQSNALGGNPLTSGTIAFYLAPSRNFLIGGTTDGGQKLQVSGTARVSGVTTVGGGSNDLLKFEADTAGNGGYLMGRNAADTDYTPLILIGNGLTLKYRNGANSSANALAIDSSANATFAGSATIGTLSPGNNTAAHFLTGYAANQSWPARISAIYDASYVDTYVTLNGTLTGTRATPTFTGATTGGAYLRFNGANSEFVLGTYVGGAGAAAVPALTLKTGNATFAGSIAINNTVQTAAGVASTHKVTISIGGSTYYLLATNV